MTKEQREALMNKFLKLNAMDLPIIVDEMLRLSREGHAEEIVDMWMELETHKQVVNVQWIYGLWIDSANRHQEDDGKLRDAFPRALYQTLFKTLFEYKSASLRSFFDYCVDIINQKKIYTEELPKFIKNWVDRINQIDPIKDNIKDAQIPLIVKSFAVYLNNYKRNKERLAKLEAELEDIQNSDIQDWEELKVKLDDYETTLFTMRINRNSLLKTISELTSKIRVNIGARLYNIQDSENQISKLKEYLKDSKDTESKKEDEDMQVN